MESSFAVVGKSDSWKSENKATRAITNRPDQTKSRHCLPEFDGGERCTEKTKMAAAACTLNWFSLAQHHDCHDFGIMARRGVLAQIKLWEGGFVEEKEGKVTTDQDRTSVGKDKWKQVPLALKTVIFFWYFFLLCFGFMFYIFLYLKNDYWLKISMNVIVFFYK